MNMINKEPERHEIEALLPWHAAGSLSRRDADRVEQALASDGELRRRYDIVREELAETIHLNETLGAPSPRAMEKLFAAIDAEEARTPRRPRSFDLANRVSDFLSGFSPRTLAWTATAAAVAIVVQGAVIAAVVIERSGQGNSDLTGIKNDGAFADVRFIPQANSGEITKFLGAHKASVVDGPKPGGVYRIRLSAAPLPREEVGKIVRQMQRESKIVAFIAEAE
jgi:hypothetical protein